jgi:UDP-GlcNAc3NAcA epimerase
LKILTVIGTRPQFIKASPVSHALLDARIEEVIVNTGQHYDINMSELFFKELEIPGAKYDLGVGSGTHGEQTGEMLKKLEPVIEKEKPDYVLVYGDTNSTLAGSLAASKLHIPIGHVEAGLRSFNRKMPEEINRVLTDHISSLLFCPSNVSKENLKKEGITAGVHEVGDVMYDIFRKFEHQFPDDNPHGEYCLLTMHRAENTTKDVLPKRIRQISELDTRVVCPVHPRTQKYLEEYSIAIPDNLLLIDPVGWLELMGLVKHSEFVLTDSGGLQKEAFWHGKQCFTLRNETEWIETVEQKSNSIVGEEDFLDVTTIQNGDFTNPFGDGNASEEIVEIISNNSRDGLFVSKGIK